MVDTHFFNYDSKLSTFLSRFLGRRSKVLIKRILFCLMHYFAMIISIPIASFALIFVYIKLISFKTAAITISLVPGYIGNLVRLFFYRVTLAAVGKDFRIDFGSYIVYPTVEIGNRVTIEEYCVISRCTIGDDVIISAKVSTMSGRNHHHIDDLTKTFYESGGDVRTINLGNNLWIGTHAVIMEDISSGTVVGAGAVVTRKFPPNAVIAGVPARLIRIRGNREQ